MIYAVQTAPGEPVKIGYTENVTARVRQLERHYGKPLTVLATFKGDETREAEIHDRFAHLRFDGPGNRRRLEQFQPAPDLMAFLGCPLFVSANPDTVEAMIPPDQIGRDDGAVKIDKRIKALAKRVAENRGLTLAEYLSEMLRPGVQKDYAAEMKALQEELDNPPKR